MLFTVSTVKDSLENVEFFVAANLAEGRKWSSSATCSATVSGRPTEVRRDETAGVKSRARAYIGATPVDTWLIQRHVIIRETTGTATVVTEEATNELFAPSLGLSVFRTTRTDVSQADGQVVSQVESVELASTTPR